MIYPLLITTVKNNLEIGTENKIILELNKKDDMLGIYPILLVTRCNNIKTVKLLIDYDNKNK